MNDDRKILRFPTPECLVCLNCGGSEVRTSVEDQEFVYGVAEKEVNLHAIVPVRTCAACGFSYTDEKAEDARHEAVCRHLGVMTPLEVRYVRECHGLSRAEFARITGIGEASLARWESGSLIQNTANDQFLFLMTLAGTLDKLKSRDRTKPLQRVAACDSQVASRRSPKFRCLRNEDEMKLAASRFTLRTA